MTVEGGSGFRVTLEGSDEAFLVAPGESVLDAARRSGHWLPFECGWGSCGRCRATLVDGDLELMFADAPAINERDVRRKRHLMCQSTPASDVVIKATSVDDVPPDERPVVDHVGRLVSLRDLGPDIRELRFALTTAGVPAMAQFRPGQYGVLELQSGLRRCYSMSNLPGTEHVEFIVKRYSGKPGSSAVFELQLGDEIPITLPYGDMWLRDRHRPALLIAGGTGISAILSLVRSMVGSAAWVERPVHVLYGAATREELVCWDELQELLEHLPNARLHGALVQPDDSWAGSRGFVTETLTDLLGVEDSHEWAPSAGVVYLAGPPPMVRAVQDVLAAHGIQLDRIHVDSFG